MAIEIRPFKAPLTSYEVEKVITNKIALIDADKYKHLVAYRMYQRLMDEGELHNTVLLNETIDDYLSRDIFNAFEADTYIFCFSAPACNVFRHAVAQEKQYKGNRLGKKDPYFYTNKWDDMAYVFEYINSRYETLFFDDLEADDILSMVQNEHTFIYSNDKDLKQVPGWHWDEERNKLIHISEEEGLRSLSLQLLKGDATDNIPGLKGFGDVALEHFKKRIIVEDLNSDDILKAVIDHFVEKNGVLKGYDTFVEMWSLLSMKIDRGTYLKEKYAKGYYTIEALCKSKTNETRPAS